jgi:hypothetical protein
MTAPWDISTSKTFTSKRKGEIMRDLSVLVLFLGTTFAALAQPANSNVSEEIKALKFLVGNWQGKVKYEPGIGQHEEVTWNSHVHYNVGGNILLIDEKGSDVNNKNNTISEVFVVVQWDSVARLYPARLYYSGKGSASSAEAKGYLQDNKFVVLRNLSSGVNRYTIMLNEKGQWYELGEVSNDGGKTWKRRFEMVLIRED